LTLQETGPWWREAIGFEAGARRGGTGESDARHLMPLVGREVAMGELFEAWELAAVRPPNVHAAGGAVWIRGPAGSGKSRLVNEFAARARTSEDPPLYLYGRCRELEEERPCGPILRMLERWLRLPPSVAPKQREKEEIEKLVPPRVAEALVRVLDPAFPGSVSLSIPIALGMWLAALGRRMPLLLCLDDVNWAGADTLAVLAHVADNLKGARLLVVLGQRDGLKVRSNVALESLREKLAAQVPARTIQLEPLGEDSVLALVRQLFHHTAPRLRLARVLWQRSRGNPGLMAELLRGLLTRGEARRHEGHDGDDGLELLVSPDELPLPRSLNKAIAESYRQLPAQDRAWLRRLAVVGGRIETDFLLAAYPDARRADVDSMLARLVRSGWLTPSGARYRFARPALREAVYQSLTREQRVKLHGQAAAALAPGADEAQSAEDSFQRAFHLRAAEDHATLLSVLPPLLARLLRGGQPQRVHSLSQWGLESIAKLTRTKDTDRLRIELLEAAADASDRLGIREDQRAILDQLSDLDLDADTDPQAIGRVYLLHGRYAVSTGQYGLARGMLRNAVEMFERAEAQSQRSEALRRLSLVQSHVGELGLARKLAISALDDATTDPQRALAHLALGTIDVLEDRVEPAMENADRALSLLRADPQWNLPGVFAAAYLLRVRVYRSSGTPARALASANRAVRLAQVAGERRLEAEATARLGGLLLDVDRPEDAEARLREALLLAEEIEDRRGQALARLFLGILLWENNDPGASAMLARASELAVEMGLNRLEALAAAIRARIFREAGELDAALSWSGRALDSVDTFGAELADRIAITGTRALVLSTAGRADEADALESKLSQRLRRENARIRSPLLRLRHLRAGERLLAAVLSPDGPVYPRLRIAEVEKET
jgi:tetratricopeptide (TPR) repeat protein